jgi:hypothetical protein
MIKRNKELEIEALQELDQADRQKRKSSRSNSMSESQNLTNKEIARLNKEREKAELEHAIALSMALEQEKSSLAEQEEYELQEAMRQSQADYEHQLHQVKNESDDSPLFKPVADTFTQYTVPPEEDKKEKIEKEAQQDLSREPIEEKKEDPKIEESSEKLFKPVHYENKKEGPTDKKYNPLPSIVSKRSTNAWGLDSVENEKQEPPVKVDQAEPEKEEISQKENLEERKKRLKAQRDLILAKKKAERETEISQYEQEKSMTQNQAEAQPMISVKSNLNTNELEKRRDLYKKLKDNVL